MKVTLKQVKESDIPQAVGISACDTARFVPLLNQAIQRLTMSGECWWNCIHTYRIAVTDGLITWPREIATIESIAKCGLPIQSRSQWFSYVSAGYGLRDKNAYCDTRYDNCKWDSQAFDRGSSPLFRDVIPTGNDKSIKLYADIAENGTDYVWIFGTDADGNVLRTNTSGNEWVDGIRVLTPTNPAVPSVFPGTVATITAVNKPQTRGALRLYEYDTVLATQREIAVYQADETNPSYRRTFVGGLCENGDTTVQVLAKREFAPVINDEDNLLLGSIPAIKQMMLAVRKQDQGLFQDAQAYEAKAFEILDREAQHYLGNTSAPLQFQSDIWGGGVMPALF